MIFDDVWTDEIGDVDQGQPLGPGRHSGQIVKAEEAHIRRNQSETNPSGKSLKLLIEVPGHALFEHSVPAHWQRAIAVVCQAARVRPPQRGEDWDEQQLVGQYVAFDCETTTSKAGNEYLKVVKWHKQADPLPPAKPAVQRDRRAKVQTADADDIPF